GMTGRAITLNQPVPNFDAIGFNDRAQSAIVNSGTWQVCADADYLSSCEVLNPGQYPNLGGVTGRVSSARPMSGGGPGAGTGPGQGGGWGGRTRVWWWEGRDFSGGHYTGDSHVLG